MDYKYDVFISYSRKDNVIADKICTSMDKVGITYFIDRQGIGGGLEFPLVLAKAIRESELFLFLGSKNSYCSKFTINEITYAFNKKERNRILPYIVDSSCLPEDLEFVFAGINWRILDNHPIDTVLIPDLLKLLGRKSISLEDTLLERGKRLFEQEHYFEAVELFTFVANQGNAEAQFELGRCYWTGDGVTQNWYETIKWIKKSAEQNNPKALLLLGRLYEDANERDINRDYLRNHYGINEPSIEAFKLYHEAVSKGNSTAMYDIASCYERGVGVERNSEEAVKWYKMYSEKEPNGLEAVGRCYRDGIGVEKDIVEAIKWWRKAVDNGCLGAATDIGICYYNGNGVIKNYNEAFMWFRKAVEPYDDGCKWSEAPFYIGECYYSGKGVEKNVSEAIKWWKIAADGLDPRAKARLRELYVQ